MLNTTVLMSQGNSRMEMRGKLENCVTNKPVDSTRENKITTVESVDLPCKVVKRPGQLKPEPDSQCNTSATASDLISSNNEKQVAPVKKDSSSQEHELVPENVQAELAYSDERMLADIFENLDSDKSDWTASLAKISKAILCDSNDMAHARVQLLISLKFLDRFREYITVSSITSLREFLDDSKKVKLHWPTLKRLYTIVWISCDQNVNFCQHLLTSDIFQFFVENLKCFSNNKYEDNEAKLFSVKACLGILHNISRHLPTRKWQLRNEGLVSATQPFLASTVPIVRLKTLITLSYIISEAENEMINSKDDNFVFIFEVLADSLKTPDRRSSKFGMSSIEVLKGLNNLAINDENKIRIVKNGALDQYQEILCTGTPEEIKLTITTLWSLSFHHYNKTKMREMPLIMEKLCELQQHSDEEISHAARGTFWELGNASKTSIGKSISSLSADKDSNQPHIMISYQWDCQAIMLQVKDRLRKAGYKVWMDVEHMTGSTLEAMALAVEKAAVVLVCMSQKYKDSPNCRTEAEYVYRLRKDFVPLRLQHEYVPDGWLGILVGTRLYFDVYTEDLLENQIPRLVRELRNRGKISPNEDICENDIVPMVTKRLTSRESVPVLNHVTSPEVSRWSCRDVKHWLECLGLAEDQTMFDRIDGSLLLEMNKIQITSPEYFHQMLRKDFQLSVYDALKISRAIRLLQ